MAEQGWSSSSLDELSEAYRRAALEHGRVSATDDDLRANAAAEVIAAVYQELRHRDARETLLPLVRDDDEAVRAWAAAHALEYAPGVGERALTVLSAGAGRAAFNASMTPARVAGRPADVSVSRRPAWDGQDRRRPHPKARPSASELAVMPT